MIFDEGNASTVMAKRETRGSFELSDMQIKRGRQSCMGAIAVLGMLEVDKGDMEGKIEISEGTQRKLGNSKT